MSHLLVVIMILYINIGNVLNGTIVYFMIFNVVCKGKIFLSILMPSVTCFHFSVQEEDKLWHSYAKCHLCTFEVIL